MEFKEYRFDLMDMYGGIDRKWKVDESGHKLIRMDGQDNEQYFYYLPDFTTPGLRAWWRGLRTFSLVVNKQEVPLTFIQRWKLFGLLEDKFSDVKRLVTAKKKMVKAVKKVGKVVPPVSTLKAVKNMFFGDDEKEEYNEALKNYERRRSGPTPTSEPKPLKGRLSSYDEFSYGINQMSEYRKNLQTKLEAELIKQNAYDDKIKRRAEDMLKGAISKEELFSERLKGINKKISRLEQLMRDGH
jgi:hypothetical protein